MPHLTRSHLASARQALAGRSETDICRTLEDLSPPLCKADGKPLCEPCWRGGKGCVGEVTWNFDFNAPKRWLSAAAAAYGWID